MAGLREAFDKSVAVNAQLLGGLDDAVVEAGRAIATRVDEAVEFADGQEVTKALYLLPHLMNVLREMYATPKARQEAGLKKEESVGGKLAQLQALKGGRAS
jgi:hypothetical protein